MCSKTTPTILVLDPDVQRRMQIRYTLSLHGYHVVEASNSRQAETICSVDEVPIDLVIRDAGAESGFEWPPWRPRAPLLLTERESQSQNSPDDFWRLPFDPEQLLSQVHTALAQTGPANVVAINAKDNRNFEPERNDDTNSLQPEVGTPGAVLIVEDEEPLRRIVSQMLRRSGFSVFETGDGASAITLFAEHAEEIEVVLLDMTLPIMSGREVFEAIKQIRPRVKVILTTAHSEEMVMRLIWTSRPWAFVRKPYRASDLVKLVGAAQTQEDEQ